MLSEGYHIAIEFKVAFYWNNVLFATMVRDTVVRWAGSQTNVVKEARKEIGNK